MAPERRSRAEQFASLSIAASGIVHLAVVGEHSLHTPAHGLFFAALGVFQIGWAVAHWLMPRRWLRWAGLVLSGGMVVLWSITRLYPAPFHGVAEEIDAAGLVSKTLELSGAGALLAMEWKPARGTARRARVVGAGIAVSLIAGILTYAAGFALEPLAPPVLVARESDEDEISAPIHGHTAARRIRLDEVPAGPYRIRAVTSPGPERPENLTLEVRVTDARGRAITDAIIRARAVETATGEVVETELVQGLAPIPRDYGGVLEISRAGTWRVDLLIEGKGSTAQAGFELLVTSGGGVGSALSAYLPFGGLLLLVVAYLLLNRPGRRREEPAPGSTGPA